MPPRQHASSVPSELGWLHTPVRLFLLGTSARLQRLCLPAGLTTFVFHELEHAICTACSSFELVLPATLPAVCHEAASSPVAVFVRAVLSVVVYMRLVAWCACQQRGMWLISQYQHLHGRLHSDNALDAPGWTALAGQLLTCSPVCTRAPEAVVSVTLEVTVKSALKNA